MPRRPSVKTSEVQERRRRVAELTLQRTSPTRIARLLKVPVQTVYNDTAKLREQWHQDAMGNVSAYTALELASLTEDERVLRERWMEVDDTMPWLQIFDRIHKLRERRAKMLGLDAPTEVRVAAADLMEMVQSIVHAIAEVVDDAPLRLEIAERIETIMEQFGAA